MVNMSNLWQAISSEEIWLPKNLTWKDVDAMPNYPRGKDLYLAFVVAAFLSVLRFVLNKLVFERLAHAVGIRIESKRTKEALALEEALKSTKMEKTQIERLARELNCTVRHIEVWLRRRRNATLKMKKFTEGAWRLMFYSFAVVYGFVTVWGKSWVFNIADCFPEYLHEQVVDEQIRWYYIIELGFYYSLCASLMFDIRRKDFKMMVFHHVYTIVLIMGSWLVNTTYIGCLVMLVHDVADVPIEALKLAIYLKNEMLSTLLFSIFLVVWCVSRLVYYPFFIIDGGLRYSGPYLSTFCFYLLNGLMVALFVLHLMWTWMIFKMVRNMINKKGVSDVRSDDEMNSEEDDPDEAKRK